MERSQLNRLTTVENNYALKAPTQIKPQPQHNPTISRNNVSEVKKEEPKEKKFLFGDQFIKFYGLFCALDELYDKRSESDSPAIFLLLFSHILNTKKHYGIRKFLLNPKLDGSREEESIKSVKEAKTVLGTLFENLINTAYEATLSEDKAQAQFFTIWFLANEETVREFFNQYVSHKESNKAWKAFANVMVTQKEELDTIFDEISHCYVLCMKAISSGSNKSLLKFLSALKGHLILFFDALEKNENYKYFDFRKADFEQYIAGLETMLDEDEKLSAQAKDELSLITHGLNHIYDITNRNSIVFAQKANNINNAINISSNNWQAYLNAIISAFSTSTSITLPESIRVTTPLHYVLIGCTNLTDIIIDSSDDKKIHRIKSSLPKPLRDKVISKAMYDAKQEEEARNNESKQIMQTYIEVKDRFTTGLMDWKKDFPDSVKEQLKMHLKLMNNFHQGCAEIDKKHTGLIKRGEKDAANATRQLKRTLHEAFVAYANASREQNEPERMNSLTIFQQTCLDAIKDSRPVLEHHRGWKKVLANLSIAIATLGVGLVAFGAMNYHSTHGKHFFFHPKTDSEKMLDQTEKTILKLG